jgi:hypothetical protein
MTKKSWQQDVRTLLQQWVLIFISSGVDVKIEQFPEDPMYPYVGKYIAHLTLAQVKTLDCGSKRQDDYRKTLPCHR